MELKINAINLRSVDYKDNDKMLSLFSLEKGLLGAGIKGVKKQGAKLSFAAQPFCFAEYLLNVTSGRYTVTGATEIESFYNLRLNLKSYYGGAVISQFILKCAEEDDGDEELFMLAVDSLKRLNYGEENQKAVVGHFLIEFFRILGYGINCSCCAKCKKDEFLEEHAYFNFEEGLLICENCEDGKGTRILGQTARALVALCKGEETDDESLSYALKFLNYYAHRKMGILSDCITQFIEI